MRALVLHVGAKRLLATFYETNDSVSIYIGGEHTHCAHVSITKPESPFAAVADPQIGYLVQLNYNQNCDLENQFKRSTDTHMILALIVAVIKDNYPYVTRLQFADASYRVCDNGATTELPEMYYVAGGRTWYEMRFGAYLIGDDLAKFKAADIRFQEKKAHIQWDLMKRIMGLTDNKWQELYESSATWQEFFGPIREQSGAADFCTFVSPWLHTFLLKTLRFNFLAAAYFIDVAKMPPLAYTSEPYSAGGRRQTLKRPKRRPRNET